MTAVKSLHFLFSIIFLIFQVKASLKLWSVLNLAVSDPWALKAAEQGWDISTMTLEVPRVSCACFKPECPAILIYTEEQAGQTAAGVTLTLCLFSTKTRGKVYAAKQPHKLLKEYCNPHQSQWLSFVCTKTWKHCQEWKGLTSGKLLSRSTGNTELQVSQ